MLGAFVSAEHVIANRFAQRTDLLDLLLSDAKLCERGRQVFDHDIDM